jgi:putative transposase
MSTAGHSPTDVSNEQWNILHLLLPKPTWRPGRPGRKPLELRRVLHGIFYVNKTGCLWRMMPQDLGNGHMLDGYFRRWRREGVWERQGQGRLPEPSAGCVESQSIKTTTQGTDVGFDGNKKVKGRKRHMLIDTLGLIVAVVVTAANRDDRQGVVELLQRYCASGMQQLRKIWVDGSYQAQWLCERVRSLTQTHKSDLEVVEHTGKGFQVVKHRWKGERSHL